MPKVDYSKCVIYKIQHRWKDELLYIGSTTNFAKRKVQHKQRCYDGSTKSNYRLYSTIRDNEGWGAFNMVIVKEYPCENKRQAEAEEDRIIREMKSSLNMRKAYITKEESKERDKKTAKMRYENNKNKIEFIEKEKKRKMEYYEKNKFDVLGKQKVYYENNKDKINERQKKHYHENIDKYKKYNIENKDTISEKKKVYRQKNIDIILKKEQTYRQINKDRIKERREKNKEKNNEKFDCACGGKYTHTNKAVHCKSKKHQTFINQQTDQ